MKVFLGTLGSMGDIFPFALIGRELKSRGHQVWLLSNPFLADMDQLGLNFHAIFDDQMRGTFRQAYENESRDPEFLLLNYLTIPAIKPTMAFLAENATGGDVLLVSLNRVFGMTLASEKWRIPRIIMHHSPDGLQNGLSRSVIETFELLRKPLNEARQQWSLPEKQTAPYQWLHENALHIGLFPKWFCNTEPAWEEPVVFTGFPLDQSVKPIDAELERFFDVPERPLLFVDGTFNPDPKSFVQQACKISTQINRPALIISSKAAAWQAERPPQVKSIPFAPYRTILSSCAAMIHHGGIGTTAEALAAGVPQLVVANAYDQLRHARLIEDLGVGLASSPSDFLNFDATLAQIESLLRSQKVADSCAHYASLLNPRTAVSDICDLIEAHWMTAMNIGMPPSSV